MIPSVRSVPLESVLDSYIGGLWGEEPGRSEVDVKVMRITELGANGTSDLSTSAIRSLTAKQVASRKLHEGDLVLEKSGGGPKTPVGRVALIGALSQEVICSNFMLLMRPNHGLVLSKYLHHFLTYLHITGQTIPLQSSSTNIRNISTPDYMQIDVPLPTLEEQRRIVETLDDHLSKLDKALADLEVAANRSRHLFLAALEEAIEECDTTTYQPLEACLNAIDQKKKVQRGWSPQCLSHPQSDSSIWAVLKTTAVQNMRYEPQHNKELPKSLEPKTHLEVQEGDFLMTTTGPRNRCGVVCLVTSTPQKLIFSGKILRFQPDSTKLLPAWLELVLASHKYQKQLDRLKVGSSDSSVSIGNAQVLELTVPVPSLVEQIRLVGNVEKMKALAEGFEMEIDQEAQKFKQLRKALLHSAFSGNLGGK